MTDNVINLIQETPAIVEEVQTQPQEQIVQDFSPNTFFQYVGMFNETAGNFDGIRQDTSLLFQKLKDQLAVLQSEVQEMQDALDAGDAVEVLDAAIDIDFVNTGLLQMLYIAGFAVPEAAELVCYNNLDKFPLVPSEDEPSTIVEDTIAKYAEKGIEVAVSKKKMYNPADGAFEVYIFKNAKTGKVLKPFGFEEVEIADAVPQVIKDDFKGFVE